MTICFFAEERKCQSKRSIATKNGWNRSKRTAKNSLPQKFVFPAIQDAVIDLSDVKVRNISYD
ncbi:MAG: hypothetical protein AUF79_08000 [Crenarchaeota archaeon 13_1_20CM_2_51_8]|nr:MAG: hypothetical protein AUF79_08000 [Crenarchaeota archaeon 13_1_20CM_2_51_8]